MTNTFRYIRLEEVNAYAAIGWKRLPVLDQTHHGEWSAMMEWTGEGEERIPDKAGAPPVIEEARQ